MGTKIQNKQLQITSNFDFENHRLLNLAYPSGSTDATNKDYVDINAINYSVGTGIFNGFTITISGGTHFSISSGIGYIVDPVTKQSIEIVFTGATYVPLMSLSPNDITISIGVLQDKSVFQQIPFFTSAQRRSMLCLGELLVDPFTQLLDIVRFRPIFSWDTSTAVDDSLFMGIKNVTGNSISASGTTLMMNVSAGDIYGYAINAARSYSNPNTSTFSGVTGFSFISTFHNGTEWIYQTSGYTINPALYSNGTPTLQSVASNKWSVRLIMRDAMNGKMWISYPTQTDTYADSASAIGDLDNLHITIPDELFNTVLACSFLIVRGGASDLSSTGDGVFVPVQSMNIIAGGSTSVLASDVSFNNSTTTGITSINVQNTLVEVNNKIESFDYSFNNQEMVVNSGVSGIYKATNTTITDIPKTRVRVEVNSLEVKVGNGTKTAYCYFSGDSGTTARTYSNVAQGDSLYWNGDVAEYQLNDITDTITFIYMTY